MSIHAVSAAFKYDCPNPSAKLVLLALANYANAEGVAYPSVDLVSKETGLSERTVRSCLKALADCGAISITARRRRDGSQASSEYNLNIQGAAIAPRDADRVQIMSSQGARFAPLTTFEPSLEPKDIVVETTDAPKAKDRTYPEAFEIAWKAYPHHKGRSSKPNALREWRKLPVAERENLAEAIETFRPQVETVCGGKGAPCMARWIKDGKHLNWFAQPAGEPETGAAWEGPAQLRAAVVAEAGEGVAASYIDPACWDGRAIIARTEFGARKLRSLHCLRNVEISISQGRAA